MRALVLACALLLACGGVETDPRTSSGAGRDAGDVDAGDAGPPCEPCSALHLCVVSCHPAGTPPTYCQACYDAGP